MTQWRYSRQNFCRVELLPGGEAEWQKNSFTSANDRQRSGAAGGAGRYWSHQLEWDQCNCRHNFGVLPDSRPPPRTLLLPRPGAPRQRSPCSPTVSAAPHYSVNFSGSPTVSVPCHCALLYGLLRLFNNTFFLLNLSILFFSARFLLFSGGRKMFLFAWGFLLQIIQWIFMRLF